jgi:hypothetical protein
MLFFWQIGLVDSLTFVQFVANFSTQYGIIAAAESVGTESFKNLLAPISGLRTGYQFVKQQGITSVERRQRIATLASYLSVSGTTMATADVSTNAAAGAEVVAYIQHMRSIIEKSGGSAGFIMPMKAPLTLSEQVILILTVTGSIILIYIYFRICRRAMNFGSRLKEKVLSSNHRYTFTEKAKRIMRSFLNSLRPKN